MLSAVTAPAVGGYGPHCTRSIGPLNSPAADRVLASARIEAIAEATSAWRARTSVPAARPRPNRGRF